MTAENYKAYLENEKSHGREVPRPLKDEDRAAVYDEVFGSSKSKTKSKGKSKDE